ncbi:hypothetical protein H6G00_19635 [Leptolyngbya sp. FACHB-541]|uniref:hypothetical protein n=1 Tax=Leptolyngbya sp. FACHB-541 TaxID=2692810 RepID=UPI001682A528|nr:hypothetical protein [Leptolyngbya sp. FACHB-541]MBD1998806.1 hypothetical protein [Leptolyngbya sp. FACHB-541]
MISPIYSATTSAIAIDTPAVQSIAPTENKPSRTRLSAHWEVIDNKLVCQWRLSD